MLAVVVGTVACSNEGDGDLPGSTDASGDDASTAASTGDVSTTSGTSGASTSGSMESAESSVEPMPDVGTETPFANLCSTEPPAGAALPPPLPTYEGTCPALQAGRNIIESSGAERELVLVVPKDLQPEEQVPVFFLWHWLGGSADDFVEVGDVQAAADVFRFVAVVPEAKGDLAFRWPYTLTDSDERRDEEFRFFDDMLACVAEQFEVNESCISTVGVSAGALFIAQLAQGRGEYLASFLSLSGGSGGDAIRPWSGSTHTMPAMVLWGGPEDSCFLDFDVLSRDLGQQLDGDGHFVLECVHNCAHGQPPFEVADAMTDFEPLWMFALDHPYWLEDGGSPWLEGGSMPASMPAWCSMGVGTSEIREGECGPSQC
jgi:predicted esterase